jgi:hypothetical protein
MTCLEFSIRHNPNRTNPVQRLIRFDSMKRFYWSGISRDDRIKAISEITDVVNRYASILNFQKFSDLSLNLVLEERKVSDLFRGLQTILSMEKSDTETSVSTADCSVLLSITFAKSKGDLKVEVPNIPE